MPVQIPKPIKPFEAGLHAELEAFCELGSGAILPVVQILVGGLAYMIGHMEPEQARNAVIQAVAQQLKPMAEKIFDETRKTDGGILLPNGAEKSRLG